MKNPAHRYEQIAETKTAPKEPKEKALYNLLKGKPCNLPSVVSAWDIYNHEYKREVLEAGLLSGMSAEEIEQLLNVPSEVTNIYCYFFFDVSVFANVLDKTDYAYTYTKSQFGAELKKFAVDVGKECLKIRLGGNEQKLPANYIVNSIRSTAFLLANLVRTNKLNNSTANLALRWATIALKAADTKVEESSNNLVDMLRIQLETTKIENEEEIPENEVVH